MTEEVYQPIGWIARYKEAFNKKLVKTGDCVRLYQSESSATKAAKQHLGYFDRQAGYSTIPFEDYVEVLPVYL